MKAELAMLKGENTKDHLEPYEIEECKKKVEAFIDSNDPSESLILSIVWRFTKF